MRASLIVALLLLALPARAEVPPPNLAPLVARLLPAVVNVSSDRLSKDADDPSKPRKRESLGSGFLVDPTGIIVTNNHVINGAYEITVTLQDHNSHKATVIAASKIADIAILKINASKPLPIVTFGDDEKMKVGDEVIAIGNPLGLGGSVSVGIISGTNRNIGLSGYDDFIQTDAAINHGNSGGPLFNIAGELIGVNTAIISPQDQGGSVGLGFAIPATNVKFVMNQLLRYGRVRPGVISVVAQDVTPDIAQGVGLSDVSGVILLDVLPNGPAQKAGLRPGDVIRSVGDRTVTDVRALRREVALVPLGGMAELHILREGRMLTVPVMTEEQILPPGAEDNTGGVVRPPPEVFTPDLGLHMEALTDYARGKYGLDPGQSGVLVSSVDPNSVADDHRLIVGNVITRVQETPVSKPEEVLARFDGLRHDNKPVALVEVADRDGLRWVALPLRLLRPEEAISPPPGAATAGSGPAPAAKSVP